MLGGLFLAILAVGVFVAWQLSQNNAGGEPPDYAVLKYRFNDKDGLATYAVEDCGVAPDHPTLQELATHYTRAHLFLLGLHGRGGASLADRWLNDDKYRSECERYFRWNAGIGDPEPRDDGKPRGMLHFAYRFLDHRALKTIWRPRFGPYDPRVPHHHACPEGFHIVLETPLSGYNRHEDRPQIVQPGVYACRTKVSIYGDLGAFENSLIMFDREATDVLVEGKSIYEACRSGKALIIAVTLYDLPTHLLGPATRPEWAESWDCLASVEPLDMSANDRPTASRLAQQYMDELGSRTSYSLKNMWASWLFNPVHGTWPDSQLWNRYYSNVDKMEVFG